jgi:RIO kinase 1
LFFYEREIEVDEPTWFEELFDEGLITDVEMQLKSGKEASVYLCRANPSTTGSDLLVAKVFRPRRTRSFKEDAAYKSGRVILKARTRRAVHKKTRFGQEFEDAWWINREHETLELLHSVGADVPRPVRGSAFGILMEYIGDEEGPAPQLRDVRLGHEEARVVFGRIMANVDLFLRNNLVHADLSPFNILYREGKATIIDFPQAVDARTNRNSYELLRRDLENLTRHFSRYGLTDDPESLTSELWYRYLFARL